jgi:hypothetical protein
MEDLVTIEGTVNTIKYVNPENTYFIASYLDKEIKGTGLHDTGWEELPDGLLKLSYYLSNGVHIEIPSLFTEYLHLVEVSQAVITGNKVFHFVYIKGKTPSGKVISYKISLKEDKNINVNIGDILVSEDSSIKSKHWKKATIG